MCELAKTLREWNGRVEKRIVNGYVLIRVGLQWLQEHRLVAEEILGRSLTKEEVIHHIDHDRQNNKPENLALFESQKAHSHFHTQLKQFGETRTLLREIEKRKIINLSLTN